jgi:hypothetical protein
MAKKVMFLAIILGFAIALSSCATAAAVADAAIAGTIKPSDPDDKSESESAIQNNISQNNTSSTNVTVNNYITQAPATQALPEQPKAKADSISSETPVTSTRSGIGIITNNQDLEKQLKSLILKAEGNFKEDPQTAILVLNANTTERVNPNDPDDKNPVWFCWANIDVELQNKSIEKKLFFDTFKGDKGAKTDKKQSCQDSVDSAVSKIWEQIEKILTNQKEFK